MTNSIEAVRGLDEAVKQAKSHTKKQECSIETLVGAWDKVTDLAANTDLSQVLKDLEELEAHRKAFRQASENGSMTEGGYNLYRRTIERARGANR